jgi:hypothetical protein
MALTQPGPGRSMDSGINEDPGDEVSRDQTIAVESRDAERIRLSVGHSTARTYAKD